MRSRRAAADPNNDDDDKSEEDSRGWNTVMPSPPMVSVAAAAAAPPPGKSFSKPTAAAASAARSISSTGVGYHHANADLCSLSSRGVTNPPSGEHGTDVFVVSAVVSAVEFRREEGAAALLALPAEDLPRWVLLLARL